MNFQRQSKFVVHNFEKKKKYFEMKPLFLSFSCNLSPVYLRVKKIYLSEPPWQLFEINFHLLKTRKLGRIKNV